MSENAVEPKIHSPYIYARKTAEKPKTSVWAIVNKKSGVELGYVRWYGPWRQYCFFPAPFVEPVFNSECMEQIWRFLKSVNRDHKRQRIAT